MASDTLAEYQRLRTERREIISRNRSRRMRGLSVEPTPPKPERPKVPIAYTVDGGYIGRLNDASELPDGATLRWEPAVW